MTVTNDEIDAERERATQIFNGYGGAIEQEWIEPLKLRAMESIAIMRKEARREALREALCMMMRMAEQHRIDGWDVVADVLYRLGAEIRALLGPET